MACSGLHCAGCAGGMAIPVVPLLEAYGLAWVAEHLVEVAIVSAACGILAIAAVVALMRRQERREADRAARGTLFVTRADVTPLPLPGRRELAPVVNIYVADGSMAARVTRHAPSGTAGEATTKEE